MKAQSFFGGTHPHETGEEVRQKGNSGTINGGGLNITRKTRVKQAHSNPVPTHIARKTKVKQVGPKGRMA